MAELSGSILRRVCPTSFFQATVIGHELREEEEPKNKPWFMVKERLTGNAAPRNPAPEPAKRMWYELHKAAPVTRSTSSVAYYKVGCATHDRSVVWEVDHRYSEFCTLHELLTRSGIELPPLPRAHFFKGSADPEVIQERIAGLGEFLSEISHFAQTVPEVRSFFDVEEVEVQLRQEAKIQGRMALSEVKELMESPEGATHEAALRLLGIAKDAFQKAAEDKALSEVRELLQSTVPLGTGNAVLQPGGGQAEQALDEDVDRVSEVYSISVITI